MNTPLSESEKAVLAPISDAELAVMWATLNTGELPAVLLPVAPANWQSLDSGAKNAWVWPIMAEIMHRVGRKECLRAWNSERMTPTEFEAWWRATGEKATASIQRFIEARK